LSELVERVVYQVLEVMALAQFTEWLWLAVVQAVEMVSVLVLLGQSHY
jgi:hypothetical protein